VFEVIGVFIAFVVFSVLAATAGLVVALLTGLIFWPRWRRAMPLGIAAIVLAPLCVVWLYAMVIALPYESLFGDIDEALPNGYHLRALGKMPDFASFDSNSKYGEGMPEYVGRLQVQGDLVVGQYSHPFGTFTPKPVENYFIFDTKTGLHRDLPSAAALQAELHQPLHLVPTDQFRSSEPASVRQRAFNQVAILGPIIGVWALYFITVFVVRALFATRAPEPTPAT
jgi:hypothetical protein